MILFTDTSTKSHHVTMYIVITGGRSLKNETHPGRMRFEFGLIYMGLFFEGSSIDPFDELCDLL